ncbi:MAG: DUF4845 domain-containing protein [Burkholderiaceae bacterium]|nr:DUF4845 domain-containing protein [Burkholderiaceae bacterium]
MQRTNRRSRQRGLSFFGVIFIGLVGVVAFAIVGQSIPILLEYQSARSAIQRAKNESSVPAVRAAFDRSAAIEDITSIRGSDLEITKRNDQVVVSFQYTRDIHLVGPAYLVYRFQGQTD